ncbi:MAG TPA: RNA pyrophosphohydrolase [Stellaceae bacterium]|nr:RNA pyrophosphohydrolase [Stellaceae bacterium]
MTQSNGDWAAYRPGVGILLLNRERQVFVGRRIGMPAGLAPWQMPQGGVDAGEEPRTAVLRELAEEIGTDKADILGETRDWLHYDIPAEIAGDLWGGKFRGQRQKWFAMRFLGEDRDINLAADSHPEFDAWQWVAPARLPELAVPFKRRLYLDVLDEFRGYLG